MTRTVGSDTAGEAEEQAATVVAISIVVRIVAVEGTTACTAARRHGDQVLDMNGGLDERIGSTL